MEHHFFRYTQMATKAKKAFFFRTLHECIRMGRLDGGVKLSHEGAKDLLRVQLDKITFEDLSTIQKRLERTKGGRSAYVIAPARFNYESQGRNVGLITRYEFSEIAAIEGAADAIPNS